MESWLQFLASTSKEQAVAQVIGVDTTEDELFWRAMQGSSSKCDTDYIDRFAGLGGLLAVIRGLFISCILLALLFLGRILFVVLLNQLDVLSKGCACQFLQFEVDDSV